MLIYIIAFCIICFCHSTPNLLLNYSELTFIQRSPIVASITVKIDLQNKGMNINQVNGYLKQHAMELIIRDPKKWIVHGLDSFDSDGKMLINCLNSSGKLRLYRNRIPPANFRDELKRYWPSSYAGFTNDKIWAASYDLSGSCITDNPEDYFQIAMELLNKHNMGQILEQSQIVLGKTYSQDYIINAIRSTIGVRPFLRCHPSQNPESQKQYLLEVHLCLTRVYKLIDCHYSEPDICDNDKDVLYTNWP